MKILILKPSSLGDVVQALPVLRLLKLHFPHSEIYWWIDAGLKSLLQRDPDLTGVIAFERKRWSSPLNWVELVQSVLEMRGQKFDLVIDLQGLARSGTFAWLANGGMSVGLDDPREGAAGFYDIRVPRPSYYTHAVDWYLEVLRAIHVPVHQNFVWIPENEYVKAVVAQKWQPQSSRWILINPGARWMNKRWPVEHFSNLVAGLANDLPDFRFAILGGVADAPMGRSISEAAPGRCLDLTGRTTLPEMIEWIRSGEMMVTNDTGPMHVAAAMGKPVVSMFGPTEPRRTGPYAQVSRAVSADLACVPCMKQQCSHPEPLACLRGISPEHVRNAVEWHLSRIAA